MIYLAFADFSSLERTFSVEGVSEIFGENEKAEYSRFKIPKRKDEWMGSRLAVKRLILACAPELVECKLSQIQILKEASGAPYIEIEGRGRLPGWLSLSHSQGHVLAAYSPEDIRFGVDLEFIETRSIDFIRDFFTEYEVMQAMSGDAEQNSIITTIIWSAKEAVLKAITAGLRIDTRKIEIELVQNGADEQGWKNLRVSSKIIKIPSLRLVCRREGDFIQTMCVIENHDQKLVWVSV